MTNEPTAVVAGERTGKSNRPADPTDSGRRDDRTPPVRTGGLQASRADDGTGDVTLANWWNRTRYRLYAPVYGFVAKPLEPGRERAIERLDLQPDDSVLILGSGPGVDLEYLPGGASVTAIDITPSMVRRTERRAAERGLDVDARVGDAQSLPFDDDAFDAVLLHLVLSVVPDPDAVAAEAARVLTGDGRVSIYDKFVPPGEPPSLPRRAVNPLAKVLFSDLTRRLGPMLAGTGLALEPRESFLGGLYTVTVARPGG